MDGVLVDVEVKPLEVLHQLLLRSGEVVTKEELLDSVWSGTDVVEGSLPTAVSKLRKALRPYGDAVVTLPRVGYLLAAASVREARAEESAWPGLDLHEGGPVPARPQWRLVRCLARSPFREVWLAANPKTSERRVFKFALNDRGLQSLKREVALARLLHREGGGRDDVVRLLEWNFEAHPYCVESEYAGPDLLEWAESQGGLASVPLPIRVNIVAQVARAVAAAHALDILHKDLKPANVMVDQPWPGEETPRVRLGDLGSAALIAPDERAGWSITDLALARDETNASGSTVLYAAPEVLAGQLPTRASDVYSLGLLLYQMAAGDFRKQLAPGWENDIEDPSLRALIAHAAAGDPARRLSSAAELAGLLIEVPAQAKSLPPPPHRGRWLVAASGLALVLAALSVWAMIRMRHPAPLRPLHTVAVLPLNGIGTPPGDPLGVALADEVASILVAVRGFGVRPVTPAVVASSLKAETVVTGRYQIAGEKLQVSLAAIDVASGRLRWQDTMQAPANSLVSMQVQLALRVRGGLARALGGQPPAGGAEPSSEEGYQLYLRSAALASDAAENREAIGLLERAVALDPRFAPAWHALSKRHYMEARYGRGGGAALVRADEATQRVLALDPHSVAAASTMVIALVERGQLVEAYKLAEQAVRWRHDSVEAHFALSYVLRFAGLLNEAAPHCETAYLLDPRNNISGLRSCAVVFLLLDDVPRTMNYLRLDEWSEFEAALSIHSHLRHGRRAEALRVAKLHPSLSGSFALLPACAAKPVPASDDPESNYFAAAHLAYCGRPDEALTLLRRAVDGGYCAYPAMDHDPFLAPLRSKPEYGGIRADAQACQNRFLAARNKP